jgi:hypothetical protein
MNDLRQKIDEAKRRLPLPQLMAHQPHQVNPRGSHTLHSASIRIRS